MAQVEHAVQCLGGPRRGGQPQPPPAQPSQEQGGGPTTQTTTAGPPTDLTAHGLPSIPEGSPVPDGPDATVTFQSSTALLAHGGRFKNGARLADPPPSPPPLWPQEARSEPGARWGPSGWAVTSRMTIT
eukprot:3605279-Pyramimonas_sp.AAC.1